MNPSILKTAVRETVPGVRIPLPPPLILLIDRGFRLLRLFCLSRFSQFGEHSGEQLEGVRSEIASTLTSLSESHREFSMRVIAGDANYALLVCSSLSGCFQSRRLRVSLRTHSWVFEQVFDFARRNNYGDAAVRLHFTLDVGGNP